jgi:hypothetical protein
VLVFGVSEASLPIDENKRAAARIVEAGAGRAIDPVAKLLLHPFRQGLLGLDRVVDDDLVGAESGGLLVGHHPAQRRHGLRARKQDAERITR